MSSPKTPAPRKAPAGMSSSKSSGSQKSQVAKNKRKIKTEDSPTALASLKKKSAGARGAPAQGAPGQKKQKVDHEKQTEMSNESVEPFPAYNDILGSPLPTPFQTPAPSPLVTLTPTQQQQQPYTNLRAGFQTKHQVDPTSTSYSRFVHVLNFALHKNPTVLPRTSGETINSTHIDELTYKMWTICLSHGKGELLARANQYSTMLCEVKLRALARLNFLPSWWFLRERVLEWLQLNNKIVDDSDMTTHWAGALNEATRIMEKMSRRQANEQADNEFGAN